MEECNGKPKEKFPEDHHIYSKDPNDKEEVE
jgi:hypothetical protein